MKSFRTPIILGIIFLFFVSLAWYLTAENISKNQRKLPILNPSDINPLLVDETMQGVGTGHKIRNFNLTDQRGNTITGEELNGKIYVADFFFTACGGICPKMTKQMKRIQNAFADEEKVMLLSHSVTPDRDSVSVMYRYAEKNGANHDKWLFLTGDKKEIYSMARKAYFIVKEPAPGEDDGSGADFIHTENFVLIDADKRIRGYYSGIRPSSVDSLISDIRLLLSEEE